MELQQILNKVQQELKAPKSQRNNFGNYNYRNAEDILEAVKPLLGEAILVLNDEIELIGDRFYVKATAEIHLADKYFRASAYARESLDKKGMDSAQITGAASSYARKYALNGLFCIDDTKDSDSTNVGEVKKTYTPKKITKPVESKKAKIAQLLLELSGEPFLSKEKYEIICKEKTQLDLVEANFDEIYSRLLAINSEGLDNE